MGALTGHTPASTYGDIVQAGNAGAGVPATLQQIQDGLGNNTGLFLSQSQIGVGGSDIGLKRVAAKVAGFTDGGGTNLGWVQSVGQAALAANYTNATAAMTNTNLSFAVLASRFYQITGLLQVSNTVAAEGIEVDFNGGGATASIFFMTATMLTSQGGSAPTQVANTAVALATALNWSSLGDTNAHYILLSGFLKVNAGGTFIMRGQENSHSTGTATIAAGSWLSLVDAPSL